MTDRPESELRLFSATMDEHHFQKMQESPFVEVVKRLEPTGPDDHLVQFRVLGEVDLDG